MTAFDSQVAAKAAAITKPQPKACWRNAALAVGVVSSLVLQPTYYCEGYAGSSELPIPIEHAWVELEDGTVVDTSPHWMERGADNLYEATRRYSEDELIERVAAGSNQPYCVFHDQMAHEHQAAMFRLLERLK